MALGVWKGEGGRGRWRMRSLNIVLHYVGDWKADSQRASECTSWGGTTAGRSRTAWRLPALIPMAYGGGYHQAGLPSTLQTVSRCVGKLPSLRTGPASTAALAELSESAVCLLQRQSTTTNVKGGPWTRKTLSAGRVCFAGTLNHDWCRWFASFIPHPSQTFLGVSALWEELEYLHGDGARPRLFLSGWLAPWALFNLVGLSRSRLVVGALFELGGHPDLG